MSQPSNTTHERVSSWFLGPRAENADFLLWHTNQHLARHVQARKDYFPKDPNFITPNMQASDAFRESQQLISDRAYNIGTLLANHSVPLWSPRFNGHMNMEITLPGILGYFMTMLYNPNNVANEASPVTTAIEYIVGQQLSDMLGYNTDPREADKPLAWGHITCDGSVANLESIWAARNLKFYPLSLVLASRPDAPLDFIASSFTVPLCAGASKLLSECSTWELLNLKPSTVLDIPTRLFDEFGITAEYLQTALNDFSIQSVGKDYLEKQFNVKFPGQYFVGTTKHYSWPKGAAITGIGSENVIDVPVDLDARMDATALDNLLAKNLALQQPVYAVVAIMGSTEHGACDPLVEVYKLRTKYEALGLTFVIHADAAWGGYFAAMVREPKGGFSKLPSGGDFVPTMALQPYTHNEIEHFDYADSITIDPHKSGYIAYPAGGLCYKDERMRYLVTWTSPIVYRDQDNVGVPSQGVYGVEGSKPGASPASVYLSHLAISLDKEGYGSLLGEAVFSCTKMYCHWIAGITEPSDLIITPFNRLPTEKQGSSPAKVEEQKKFIRDRILNTTNADLVKDKAAMELVAELGSDICINAFACNFKINGVVNEDVVEANYFNSRIYGKFSMSQVTDNVEDKPFIVTSTSFSQAAYGACLTTWKTRLGLKGPQDLYSLVNVVMSPFPTEYNFQNELFVTFCAAAQAQMPYMLMRNAVTPDFHGFYVQGTADGRLYFTHIPMFNMENHRRQLIISGVLPKTILDKYRSERQLTPSRVFTLANAKADTLDNLLSNLTAGFDAVMDRGLPPGDGSHWASGFKLTDIKIVRNVRLNSKYLLQSAPVDMPFYLYGQNSAQANLDHCLVHSPSIQLSADVVKIAVEPAITDADMQAGLIAVAHNIKEAARLPFRDNANTDKNFFWKKGLQLNVSIYRDAGSTTVVDPSTLSNPISTGQITITDNVWIESQGLNSDPEPDTHVAQSSSKADTGVVPRHNMLHHLANPRLGAHDHVQPIANTHLYRRLAREEEWLRLVQTTTYEEPSNAPAVPDLATLRAGAVAAGIPPTI